MLVNAPSLGRASATEATFPLIPILAKGLVLVRGAAPVYARSPEFRPLDSRAVNAGPTFGGQRNSLAYQNFSAKQLASRLYIPRTWVLDNANLEYCDDPIPCLPLGKFKRFRWNSPELNAWIERHVVCPYPLEPGQEATANYEYLDSPQFAMRLNISESWVRDGVRTRATEPIPHVRFGKYVRFRWGSSELEIWAERRMLAGNNRAVSRAQGKETVQ
jgi:predicted DNA-binding transcriptional regulator AlpA